MPTGKIYCFRASYELSTKFNPSRVPDWLCLEADWQGYKIYTLPWVADVARVLGALEIEDHPDEWISHLESLGFTEVFPVICDDLFECKGYA